MKKKRGKGGEMLRKEEHGMGKRERDLGFGFFEERVAFGACVGGNS